jgi:serine/threonine-protein kinase
MLAAEKVPAAADERVERALSQVGMLVRDRWHLDALLGVGGTAAVFAATHRNGKRVALKMLHPELSACPDMRQRFLDEGYVANSVGHPGAVSVIDDDVTENGHVFLIMDLLEGETLDQVITEGGCLQPARVLTVADAVLDILAAAHDKGIVHRDVKPDNIFITADGQVRLLDFGIARMATPGRTRTTQTGTPIGTPAFMPPEQARGRLEQLDGRADLWALGATMFYLLTGRDVHEAETVAEELLAAMTKHAPSLGELAPELPPPLIDLVDRALTYERSDRWASARDMQVALRRVEALLAGKSVPSSKARTVVPASPTLVTPSLAPTASSTPPRSRPPRPVTLIAVSAIASFIALLAVRQVGKGHHPRAASAHEVAARESPSERARLAEEGQPPVVAATPAKATPPIPDTPAAESAPTSPKAASVRPKAVPRPVEDARALVSAGVRAPAALSPESASARATVPTDPLDRRK